MCCILVFAIAIAVQEALGSVPGSDKVVFVYMSLNICKRSHDTQIPCVFPSRITQYLGLDLCPFKINRLGPYNMGVNHNRSNMDVQFCESLPNSLRIIGAIVCISS